MKCLCRMLLLLQEGLPAYLVEQEPSPPPLVHGRSACLHNVFPRFNQSVAPLLVSAAHALHAFGKYYRARTCPGRFAHICTAEMFSLNSLRQAAQAYPSASAACQDPIPQGQVSRIYFLVLPFFALQARDQTTQAFLAYVSYFDTHTHTHT